MTRGQPRPKRFRAVRDFSFGTRHYRAGDVVEHGTELAQLIRLGGFVESTTTKSPTTPTSEGADHG